MASSLLMKPTVTSNRDEVYVAAVPLRAAKGPAQLLTSTAYSLNLWDFQHFMVIIKPSSPPPHSQALVFDFQPKDPENIYAALAVLSAKAIPGSYRSCQEPNAGLLDLPKQVPSIKLVNLTKTGKLI
ncbi:hypothetical protein ABKV19_009950 [Rosa sericea]